MIRISPAVRMSLGLMFITLTVVMLGNFTGLIPDYSHVQMEKRKSMAESLAVRCTYAAKNNNIADIKKTMDAIVRSRPEILSLGMRNADGRYFAQTKDHHTHWISSTERDSTFTHWQVPIYQEDKKWGILEISFARRDAVSMLGFGLSPFMLLLLFFAIISFTGFVLFMKRSLRYLDPSSVMPSRVKYALDTLTEGVLLLDTKANIILANSVFLKKTGRTVKELLGLNVSTLGWLDPETNKPSESLPWNHALSKAEIQSGVVINFDTTTEGIRTLVVNTAPILDDKQKCRGAVVTFDDVTELEKQSYQLSRMVELLQMSRDKIKVKNKELEVLASRDSLTNCLNRRAFFQMAEHSMQEVVTLRHNIACIMADLDLFKSVNDTYGHVVGDQVIQFFARTIQAEVRENDSVCRYGGEEFCVLLPDCDIDNAVEIVERIRHKVETQGSEVIADAPGIRLSASFGVSDISYGAHTIDDLIKQADDALYMAKEAGRNRLMCWKSSH